MRVMESRMSDKIDTIRSSSSGTIGRAQSVVRGQTLRLDSSARPQPDVLGVPLDQRDAAGGDSREERLAVREGVGLGPR